jgi:hypothetical protein
MWGSGHRTVWVKGTVKVNIQSLGCLGSVEDPCTTAAILISVCHRSLESFYWLSSVLFDLSPLESNHKNAKAETCLDRALALLALLHAEVVSTLAHELSF